MVDQLDLFSLLDEPNERGTKPESLRAKIVENPLLGDMPVPKGTLIDYRGKQLPVQWSRVSDGRIKASLRFTLSEFLLTDLVKEDGVWRIPGPQTVSLLTRLRSQRDAAHGRLVIARKTIPSGGPDTSEGSQALTEIAIAQRQIHDELFRQRLEAMR